MEIAGIRGPMSVPPEKGPGEGRKAGKASGRGTTGGPDSIQLSGDALRQTDGSRGTGVFSPVEAQGRLEAVRARLESGELDRPEVFKATAKKILGAAP